MVNSVMQNSFHAGEWAPALNARVDLAKYKSAAALLRNFFVDYRGGASSRTGTKYVVQAYKSASPVRLIPFQASPTVGYVLEFGDLYIRFHFQGAPVLEFAKVISGATQANPCKLTINAHGFAVGDWVLVGGVLGMTQLNGRYFVIKTVVDANNVEIANIIDGSNVNSTGYSAYTSGGTAGRIYTLSSPYLASDLSDLKFTQLVDKLFIVQRNYRPYVLTLVDATNWTLNSITFGATIASPTGLAAATTNAGTWHYGYTVTAIDADGQESLPAAMVYSTINSGGATVGSINLSWTAVTGAKSYNVYRTPPRDAADPSAGAVPGFIMNVTNVAAEDGFVGGISQNAADYSSGPAVPSNPFIGQNVDHITVTNAGVYTVNPSVTIGPPSGGGTQATGQPILGALSVTDPPTGGQSGNWTVGMTASSSNGTVIRCTDTNVFGQLTHLQMITPGTISTPGGSTPANPVTFAGPPGRSVSTDITWGVIAVNVVQAGSGYSAVPAVTFSAGAATATAVLGGQAGGNPTAIGLFQQRLVLAAKPTAVQTFDMSQPGSIYNFNISNPLQADDAITGSIVDGQLNQIQSMVSVPTGLVLLSSRSNWLISAGSGASAVTAIDITAHAHSYNGCATNPPPIVANFDILFVQSKNSIVRDLTFNFYTQIYTGTDISVLSSHLFYGFEILEWTWAEEPFKVVHAVRDDGQMLALTFLKEQDLIGWTHYDTTGLFKSVASVAEIVSFGKVDAVYTVVERVINGNTVKYIERFAERLFNDDAFDCWFVDAGLKYVGTPATTFSGAEHLAGATVTGLADGAVIPPFTMPANGVFTLSAAATNVVVGLPYIAQLQTLRLDIGGEGTIQGKRKGINGVTVRVQQTLGLTIGKDFDGSQVVMKDLVLGNVGSQSNGVVTGLVTDDARTIIDPSWDVPGQYCIQQVLPLPASILGVIPEIEVGDTR